MKLREGIDYAAFLKTVQQCEGEVLLVTPEGDQLNLKSTLSQFIFAAAIRGSLNFANAVLQFADPSDALRLEAFAYREE